MSKNVKDVVFQVIKENKPGGYVIPEIQKKAGIKNREKVAVALKELELEGKIKCWEKSRIKHYYI